MAWGRLARMADILLTHSNHLFYDRKQVRKMQPYPPLQTILAAAFLRQEGFDVAFFDATLERPEEGFLCALRQHGPRLVAICEDNFNFLTKMCLKRNRQLAFSLARIAGDFGIPVAVSGSDASDRASEYLAQGSTLVILGEVETSLADVARRVLGSSAGSLREVRGIAYRDGGNVRYTPPRPPLKELNLLPMPAWDLVSMSSYRKAWQKAHGFFSLNMVSSRGCPYHCNWCAKPIYGQTYRFLPPLQVAEEMRHLKQSFRPDQIWFADDISACRRAGRPSFAPPLSGLTHGYPSRCNPAAT